MCNYSTSMILPDNDDDIMFNIRQPMKIMCVEFHF